MHEDIKRRNGWRMFSPCILAAILCALIVLYSFFTINQSQGWSLIMVMMFLPALFVLILFTFVARFFTGTNTALLWLIEILAVLIVLYITLYAGWISH